MASLRFDQVNIVVPDVLGATRFLRALGAEVPEVAAEWAEWAPHHVRSPVVTDGFDADIDSPAFAAHWGGLPKDFAGVVVNLQRRIAGRSMRCSNELWRSVRKACELRTTPSGVRATPW